MLLSYVMRLLGYAGYYLCWLTPFTFVFCLIYAIKEAVTDGKRELKFGLGAAVSLLLLVAAFLLIVE